jgi:Ca2+/Na+ antiporter
MRKPKYLFILTLLPGCSSMIYAQVGNEGSGFDDMMRSNGRIYVVVAVMVTILIGLIVYLVRLDRKISKLEKNS